MVWLHSESTRIEAGRPVPLVSYGDECLFTRNAIEALGRAGRECELAFVGSSLLGLGAAVAAGFGVMPLPRSRADLVDVRVWEDAPLPKLPDIFCGVYVRAGFEREDREQIAETIAEALQSSGPPQRLDRSRSEPVRQVAASNSIL